MSGTKRKLGSPTDYTKDMVDKICEKSQMAEAYVQYAPKMVCRQ